MEDMKMKERLVKWQYLKMPNIACNVFREREKERESFVQKYVQV